MIELRLSVINQGQYNDSELGMIDNGVLHEWRSKASSSFRRSDDFRAQQRAE